MSFRSYLCKSGRRYGLISYAYRHDSCLQRRRLGNCVVRKSTPMTRISAWPIWRRYRQAQTSRPTDLFARAFQSFHNDDGDRLKRSKTQFELFEKLFVQWTVVVNRCGGKSSVLDLANLMKSAGVEPDLPTYNRLISKMMAQGHHKEAKHLASMRKEHTHLQSDFLDVQTKKRSVSQVRLHVPSVAGQDYSVFERIFIRWANFVHAFDARKLDDAGRIASAISNRPDKGRRGRRQIEESARTRTHISSQKENQSAKPRRSRKPRKQRHTEKHPNNKAADSPS